MKFIQKNAIGIRWGFSMVNGFFSMENEDRNNGKWGMGDG